jgi:prepilin-type N-terminal cleavage/methylation domain-containing protein
MKTCKQARGGYTLIELLVVITLIAVLAGLTLAFLPNAVSSAREARAAVQLQSWLNVAKQRALRDQAPRGLRLWLRAKDPTEVKDPNQVVECQYLEQPDDFSGGTIKSGVTADLVMFTDVNLWNGDATGSDPKLWSVQPGDYLEVMGTGLMHYITAVKSIQVQVKPALPHTIVTATANYRIARAPRAVGDETLKMPDGTVIDLETNGNFNNPLPPSDPSLGTGFVDILFAPSGAVISRGVATANIHLWVRAPDPNNPDDFYRGDPTIVSVFVRTGLVEAFPPAPLSATNPNNPYLLVR